MAAAVAPPTNRFHPDRAWVATARRPAHLASRYACTPIVALIG